MTMQMVAQVMKGLYWVKTPKWMKRLFPHFTWSIPTHERVLYLTFGDGPSPEATPFVLDRLDQYNAKATFFCVGENAERNPQILQRVVDQGHAIGNHTYSHPNAWQSEIKSYVRDVKKCAEKVRSKLFRPPYGRLRPRHRLVLERHYKIVMWDVLSGDFDPNISKEKCLSNVIDTAQPGSIIVFHDSIKAFDKMSYVLPRVLEYFSKKGYSFQPLS